MKHGSAQLLLFVLLSFGAHDLNAGRTDSLQARGARLYQNYCERCHGTDGAGSVNIVRNNVWAKEPTDLVKIIAFGARGPSASGNGFHRAMPPAPYNDEEIALVTMYTMQSIGKRDVVISTDEVRRARQQHLDSVQRKIKNKR
jgi:alcohol dehydrogenase (quinone), cytochrome c subunit